MLGVCTYAFLALAGRTLPAEEFATLSVLYALVYTLGPGLFQPLEQEVGRALAERGTRGEGGLPVLRRAAALGLVVVVAVVVAAGVFHRVAVDRLFGGSGLVLVGLLLSTGGLWAAHLTRGALAGSRRFGRYGAQLGLEGLVRLVGCAVLALAGTRSAGAYGLLMGGALLASVALTVPRPRDLAEPGPPAPWAELSGSLGWLLASTVLSQALVNAGPVTVDLLAGPEEKAAAGALLAGLVLARLPLFLFQAVQASLLPGLARQLAAGRTREFLRGVLSLVGLVVALMGVATVGAGLLGAFATRLLFGPRLALPGATMAEITGATGAFMAAVVLAQALVALRRYARVVLGWLVGLGGFVLCTALGGGLVDRVVHGYLSGSLAAVLVLGALLPGALRRVRPAPMPVDLAPATGVES